MSPKKADPRRKELKRIAKEHLRQQSEHFQAVLEQTNLTSRESRAKERELENNRTQILRGDVLGRDFLVFLTMRLEEMARLIDAGAPAVYASTGRGSTDYLHCEFCRDLLPQTADHALSCQCQNVTVDFASAERANSLYQRDQLIHIHVWIIRRPGSAHIVRLVPKANRLGAEAPTIETPPTPARPLAWWKRLRGLFRDR